MRRRDLILLGMFGLFAALLPAVFQDTPGYMDASYYYLGGINLAEGRSFQENLLWNYLDDPAGLPHPSHGYWLPLASILSWLGISLFGFFGKFTAARIPFFLLAALVPPLSALLAYQLSKERRIALLAGGFAVLSGFYLPYLGIPESFSINLVLGLLFFLIWLKMEETGRHWKYSLGMGLLTGLMHLCRTEGIIWLGIIGLVLLWTFLRERSRKSFMIGLSALGGYLLVMGPWILRNLLVLGSPLSPGGSSMLWLAEYDQLFIYPPSLLNPQFLLKSGWEAILQARWNAGIENLWTLIAVQGSIVLFPFVLYGLILQWKCGVVRAAMAGVAVIYGMMTVLFPFAGYRGGFFHAGAVWQGLFWALAALGFARLMQIIGDRFSNWEYQRALKGVGLILLLGLAALSLVVTYQRVIASDWDAEAERYAEIGTSLDELGIGDDEIILINNPPAFQLATSRSAIVIPYGDQETLLEVSRRYNARYIVLDENIPTGLVELYQTPADFEPFVLLEKLDSTYIMEIVE